MALFSNLLSGVFDRLGVSARSGSIAVVLTVAALAGCQDHHHWRQKQTIIVDTPAGEVSGMSVISVKSRFGRVLLSQNEVWYRVTGEATVVEVAPGRYLFALLGRDEERYYWAMYEKYKGIARGDWLKLIPKAQEVAVLDPDHPYPRNVSTYPMLLTFDDINDPETVREVDPKNLAAIFGPGVRLQSMTLEITDEPVTTGQMRYLLGWWFDQAEEKKGPPALRFQNASPRGYGTVSVSRFVSGIDWRK